MVENTKDTGLSGSRESVTFTGLAGDEHIVMFSQNNFENALSYQVETKTVDIFNLPSGSWQWQVCDVQNGTCVKGNGIVSDNADAPQKFVSYADGEADLFFASVNGVWGDDYAAEHQGAAGVWTGTNEHIALCGKNNIADVFAGSEDASLLVLTDDANGDALFIDDIFTQFGKDDVRLSRIDEIRAGAGDDIIDMTSLKFAASDEMTIRGGAGNDVIWAGGEDNDLFGDAGNDRIVGSTGFDLIVGGAGDDFMSSGGGDDVFAFCDNWGNDIVEITANAEITLWFKSGSVENWDEMNRIYRSGDDSVTVIGGADSKIALRFGDDGAQYDDMLAIGAFDAASSEKVFEDKGKTLIA